MGNPVRKWTNLLQDAIDGGLLEAQSVVDMCLSYMSEDAVEDMVHANDLAHYIDPEEQSEEEVEWDPELENPDWVPY